MAKYLDIFELLADEFDFGKIKVSSKDCEDGSKNCFFQCTQLKMKE